MSHWTPSEAAESCSAATPELVCHLSPRSLSWIGMPELPACVPSLTLLRCKPFQDYLQYALTHKVNMLNNDKGKVKGVETRKNKIKLDSE